MKENELKQTAIFTPVFEETRYLHHICSECGGTLHFEQSIYGEVYFYNASQGTIKFCPLCGTEIIRFSDKPIYKTPLDLTPLDIFIDLNREYERKIKWLYYCYISEERRDKIVKLIPLINKDDFPAYIYKTAKLVEDGRRIYTRKLTSTAIKHLKREFGEEQESRQ